VEKPNAATQSLFEAAFPGDARAVRGQMFGHPCGFVNGNMFYGTFGQSIVVRVGEARAAELTSPKMPIFSPMEGRGVWKEYLQIQTGDADETTIAGLAREALNHTATLPPKEKKKAAPKKKK
jgi:hypothetical protein